MSIASKLQSIVDTKAAIKTAINEKGGSITDSTPFADYATAITNLPSGGGSISLAPLSMDSVPADGITIVSTVKNWGNTRNVVYLQCVFDNSQWISISLTKSNNQWTLDTNNGSGGVDYFTLTSYQELGNMVLFSMKLNITQYPELANLPVQFVNLQELEGFETWGILSVG